MVCFHGMFAPMETNPSPEDVPQGHISDATPQCVESTLADENEIALNGIKC